MKNIPKALLPKPKWRTRESHREGRGRQPRRGSRSSSTCRRGAMTHGACSRALQPKAGAEHRQKALGEHTVRESLTRLPLLAGVQDGERFNRERTPRYTYS